MTCEEAESEVLTELEVSELSNQQDSSLITTTTSGRTEAAKTNEANFKTRDREPYVGRLRDAWRREATW